MDNHPLKTCLDCDTLLTHAHANRKRCESCAEARRRRPAGNLAPWQADQVRSMLNCYTRDEMAKRIGVSKGTIGRWLRDQGLKSNALKYGDEMIQSVIDAYEAHGKHKTQQLFPGVTVRSIVERNPHRPRQIRWLDDEIIEAARMAGLVRTNSQAAYFNRPNAYSGSIKSLWAKRFGCAPHDVNGLAVSLTWRIAKPGVLATTVYHANSSGAQAKILWLDLASWLRDDVEPWIMRAVEALARFQAWLHGTWSSDDIRQMIAQREGMQHGQ